MPFSEGPASANWEALFLEVAARLSRAACCSSASFFQAVSGCRVLARIYDHHQGHQKHCTVFTADLDPPECSKMAYRRVWGEVWEGTGEVPHHSLFCRAAVGELGADSEQWALIAAWSDLAQQSAVFGIVRNGCPRPKPHRPQLCLCVVGRPGVNCAKPAGQILAIDHANLISLLKYPRSLSDRP